MADRTIIDTEYEVMNKSSFNINFRSVLASDTTTAVAPSSVKAYIYVDRVGTIVNNRDGTTNTTGLSITDTNLINFNLAPADLTIVDATAAAKRGYEIHRVIIESLYNTDADKYIREYIIKVMYAPVSVT